MTHANLAIVWAPNLIDSNSPSLDFANQTKIIEIILNNVQDIFDL
jgi:hypothetical protein